MNPISLNEIGQMLNTVLQGFQEPIFFSFVAMITFTIALGVKRIIVGVKS